MSILRKKARPKAQQKVAKSPAKRAAARKPELKPATWNRVQTAEGWEREKRASL